MSSNKLNYNCGHVYRFIIIIMQMSSKTCNPVKHYLIRHNITLNLTDSLVNKTNATVNRVQKGNSYYFVQIIPYHTLGNIGNSATSVFYIGGQFYHNNYV